MENSENKQNELNLEQLDEAKQDNMDKNEQELLALELDLTSLNPEDSQNAKNPEELCASAEALYHNTISLMQAGELDYDSAIRLLQKAASDGCVLSSLFLGNQYANQQNASYNPAQAFEYYKNAADTSCGAGYYKTGLCYNSGFGCAKDYFLAYEAFSKGAELGDADCICALGICREFGIGCEIDYEISLELYRRAMELGSHTAANNLGGCYLYGHGVEQNKQYAIELFMRAAYMGNSNAECRLGVCCETGDGCEQDLEKAISHYLNAARDENPQALFRLANCYDKGIGVEQNFAKAYKYFEDAAKQGHIGAMYEAGMMNLVGRGTKKNEALAYKMFSAAASSGHAYSEYELGNCFFEGIGTVRNRANAYKHYLGAYEADNSCVSALWRIGLCKLKGLGTDKDEVGAFEYFCLGADKGSSEAGYMKGECLFYGVGVEKNEFEAYRAFKLAVNQGSLEDEGEQNADALLSLGLCYEKGIGTQVNLDEALSLYKKAAELGNPEALFRAGNAIITSGDKKSELGSARGFILRAARKGHLPSILAMGVFADEGRGIPKNREDAKRWYAKAVISDVENVVPLFAFPERFADRAKLKVESKIEAQYRLGMLVARSNPSSQNYIQSFEYIALAASMGHRGAQREVSKIFVFGGDLKGYYESPFSLEKATFSNGSRMPDDQTLSAAMNKLGDALFDGKGMVKKNEAAAARCYKKAAELGNVDACYSYGWCLRHGAGVKENDIKAIKWLKLAADRGNANACYSYGLCCEEGAGTGIKNKRDALSYYRKAAASGHAQAQQRYILLSESEDA